MAFYVKKYGGSSLADTDCIQRIAAQLQMAYSQGDRFVVVLSAMGNTTDQLTQLAKDIQASPDPREYARLLATGEQLSIALLSMALLQLGLKARSYTAWQVKIHTDARYKKARILNIDTCQLQADLAAGYIPIVAGFQGVTHDGDITVLGRGGSDITAVAMAVALKADECQIYTDVAGVYTTDPRVEPKARLLPSIRFADMLEMASLGAKILHMRAVEFAGKHQLPLRVLSSISEGAGTLISFEETGVEGPIVSGIAFNRNEAKISLIGLADAPGMAHKVLQAVSEHDIEIDMIVQNAAQSGRADMTFTVHRDEFVRTMAIFKQICDNLAVHRIVSDAKIAKLSLVGVGMRSHTGVASKMFAILSREAINIQLITTSEIKISVVIAEEELDRAIRALHAGFGLDQAVTQEAFDLQP